MASRGKVVYGRKDQRSYTRAEYEELQEAEMAKFEAPAEGFAEANRDIRVANSSGPEEDEYEQHNGLMGENPMTSSAATNRNPIGESAIPTMQSRKMYPSLWEAPPADEPPRRPRSREVALHSAQHKNATLERRHTEKLPRGPAPPIGIVAQKNVSRNVLLVLELQ
ncbi:hypothetical protein ACA910_019453 [Epithemia clementina (nom. ined.)]